MDGDQRVGNRPAETAANRDSNISRRRAAAKEDGGLGYQNRRDAVLKAAASVFAAKGYPAATLNDIAAAAGIDRASLYYYFSGKRELFAAVVGNVVIDNTIMAERIRDSDRPPVEKLRDVIVSLMRSYHEHYPYLYVFVQENLSQVTPTESRKWDRELDRYGRRHDKAVTDIIEAAIDEGQFSTQGSAQLLAYGIVGMLNWSHRWFRPSGPLTGEEIGEILADMIINGLRTRP
jgi:AcrR family transcriptional regulator